MANYTQLFIEGQEVDLSGVDKIGLVYSINDIRELSNRDSDKSRTIELPGTKQNHIIFGHAFEVRGAGSFNRNKRAKALLMVNGMINMEGFCKLVNCKDRNGERKFIIQLHGGNVDWVNAIGSDELTDLDFSEYDHLWTGANIRDSWDNTEGYVYPLIDYGKFGGYNISTPINDFDFFPAIFIKTIIDKIFKRIDYTLTGNFFSDPQHRNLIIPFANKDFERNQQWKEERDFVGVNDAYQTYSGGAFSKIFFTAITGNEKGYWDNTNRWLMPNEPFILNLNIDSLVEGGVGLADLTIEIYKGSTGASSATGIKLVHTNPATPTGDYPLQGDLSVQINPGEYIELRFGGINSGGGGGTTAMQIKSITVTSDISRLMLPGGVVRLNDNLPKMKQIDLIKTLYKMFGLIFQTDASNKTVRFDTFNQFYQKPDSANADSFVNWSNKIDLTGEVEQDFTITDKYGRNNLFKWKQDQEDRDIVDYMKTRGFPFNTGFGNGSFDINKDFLKQQEVIADLPFASTWMVNSFGGILHLPSIKRYIDGEYKGTPEPRILIYAGLVPVEDLTQNPNLTTLNVDSVTGGSIGYAYYWKKSYPGSVLNTFDLNLFFDNELVQFGTTLLKKYYPDLLNLIFNNELIKCWITLNEVDVSTLDFGKAVYIDYFRSYFLLNQINDYLANRNYESCQIEIMPIG